MSKKWEPGSDIKKVGTLPPLVSLNQELYYIVLSIQAFHNLKTEATYFILLLFFVFTRWGTLSLPLFFITDSVLYLLYKHPVL